MNSASNHNLNKSIIVLVLGLIIRVFCKREGLELIWRLAGRHPVRGSNRRIRRERIRNLISLMEVYSTWVWSSSEFGYEYKFIKPYSLDKKTSSSLEKPLFTALSNSLLLSSLVPF